MSLEEARTGNGVDFLADCARSFRVRFPTEANNHENIEPLRCPNDADAASIGPNNGEDSPAVFDDIYEVILADCPATRSIHRKIRYHVYCMERGYEDPAAFPNGEESDLWDDDAVQFVARERVSGRCVGAIRLILPQAVDFPVETLGCLSPATSPSQRRRQLGELSRVCIIRTPQAWMYKGPFTSGLGHVPKNRELEVLVGLVRAVSVYGLQRGIERCYVLITDAFARLLGRLGLVLEPAGEPVDHRGLRSPYLYLLRESIASASEKNEAFRELFARQSMAYRRSSEIDEDTIDPESLLIEPVVAAA